MDIRPVSVAEFLGAAGSLLGAHWDEVAQNKAVMVLAPDADAYRRLEAAGSLIALAAYVDGEMVGYSVTIVAGRHLHYSDLAYASNDVLFVAPAHRASRAGLALMQETERVAAERGCRLVLWHTKPGTALESILSRRGYAVQDVIYSKQLDAAQPQRPLRNFVRLASGIDVSPLLAAVRPEMWDQITARQEYPGSAHHDTRTIFLRGPTDPHNTFDCIDSVTYPLGDDPALRRAAEDVIDAAGLDLVEMGRVMLVSLKPGGAIDSHSDEGTYAAHFSRFHVAMQSDEGNTFACGAESVHMQAGECWWFDHRNVHEVRNASERERIHLIFDVRVSGLYRGGV